VHSYDLSRVAPNLEIRVNGGTARKIKAIGQIGQMSGIILTKIKRVFKGRHVLSKFIYIVI